MRILQRHGAQQLLLMMLAAASSAHAQVDPTLGGKWDTDKTFWSRYALRQIPAGAGQLGTVNDPFFTGKERTFLRLELAPGGSARNTIMAYPVGESASENKNGGERWYALSFALPATWTFSPTPVTVASIDVGQTSAGLKPPLAIVVKGRDIVLDMNFEQTTPDTVAGSRTLPIVLDGVQTTTWYCFVVYAKWSATLNSGALKVWNNNDLVYETQRLYNSYSPVYSNVPFVGLSVPAPDTLKREIYADMIWLGGSPGASTTHAQMRNATPCP